jgi:hypothetical protein
MSDKSIIPVFDIEKAKREDWKNLAVIVDENITEIPVSIFFLKNLVSLSISRTHTFQSGEELHTIGSSQRLNFDKDKKHFLHTLKLKSAELLSKINELQGLQKLQIVFWGTSPGLKTIPEDIAKLENLVLQRKVASEKQGNLR